jgi:LacI family transcriptional regulator, gluconate utilization system Gnt-I transcriptional repressor
MTRAAPNARSGRPGIRDVAVMAKVSTMTVARVLRDPARVAPATRRRVESALKKTGYTPDLVARALSVRQTGVVAVLIPHLGHSSFTETIQGMSDELSSDGFHILVGATGFSLEREEAIVRAFLSRRIDAVFLTGTTHSASTRRLLAASKIPVVEGINLPRKPLHLAVGCSNEAAAYAATQHLVAKGHRRIAHVGLNEPNNDRMRDRHLGYVRALKTANVRIRSEWSIATELSVAAGARALRALVALKPAPSALFCASDVFAIGAVQECNRLGLRMPGDMAIVGFDDLEFAGALIPALTTIRIPRYQIGRTAGRMLRDCLAGRPIANPIADLGFELVVRDTA